jgi:AcrR family transcriptional regulator
MARKRQEVQLERTRTEIMQTARRLMGIHGTAGLSIRMIAREMDLTPPALYYYFASLDDLITALIVEAFEAFAEALELARDSASDGSTARAMLAVCTAYRQWALDHPTDFKLIYGTPIPGYEAPREITVPAARRSYDVFWQLLLKGLKTGQVKPQPAYQAIPPSIHNQLRELVGEEQSGPIDHDVERAIYYTAVGWPQMHGIVILELFEHIQPLVGDMDLFYRQQIINLLASFGLHI